MRLSAWLRGRLSTAALSRLRSQPGAFLLAATAATVTFPTDLMAADGSNSNGSRTDVRLSREAGRRGVDHPDATDAVCALLTVTGQHHDSVVPAIVASRN